ncbi:hypothetical protein Fsol_00048 [Candidatus Fokinia solitaria]|uniref:Uncharacterized protein n=1 Tax=Candidatus Fokinia solitaria TaxID=1802984 RepID=A0A2U8BR98_9RICK|nr:hypothetical protein [Candidatus Fokinia solitaria]AWD32861.1 hypothetical protein Fsol_00048 [Candidatus Fokinia solitaria]
MKSIKYFIVSLFIIGKVSASQTLDTSKVARVAQTNKVEREIGEFEVGLQFSQIFDDIAFTMQGDITTVYNRSESTDSMPNFLGYKRNIIREFTTQDKGVRSTNLNLGWNGLQSKIGKNCMLLGSIGCTIGYSEVDLAQVESDAAFDSVLLHRVILGVRGSIAPLYSLGKSAKIGIYAAGTLGADKTYKSKAITESKTILHIKNFKAGTTATAVTEDNGTISWSDVDTSLLGYGDVQKKKLQIIDTSKWNFYYCGEFGVRLQKQNFGIQIGVLFNNSVRDAAVHKGAALGEVWKGITTATNFHAVAPVTAVTRSGETINLDSENTDKIEATEALIFYAVDSDPITVTGTEVKNITMMDDVKFKRQADAISKFFTVSLVFDL